MGIFDGELKLFSTLLHVGTREKKQNLSPQIQKKVWKIFSGFDGRKAV